MGGRNKCVSCDNSDLISLFAMNNCGKKCILHSMMISDGSSLKSRSDLCGLSRNLEV